MLDHIAGVNAIAMASLHESPEFDDVLAWNAPKREGFPPPPPSANASNSPKPDSYLIQQKEGSYAIRNTSVHSLETRGRRRCGKLHHLSKTAEPAVLFSCNRRYNSRRVIMKSLIGLIALTA